MNKKYKDDSEYRTLSRLFNKRSHSIETYEKKPDERALGNVLKWVRLLSTHTKEMNEEEK